MKVKDYISEGKSIYPPSEEDHNKDNDNCCCFGCIVLAILILGVIIGKGCF